MTFEWRVLTKHGRTVYTGVTPILDAAVAEAALIWLDFRERYDAPHRLQRREYRETEWEGP